MKINKAYKVELKPNNRQKALLIKSIGIARFAYNWGLNQRIKLYECEKKSLSAFDQQKILSSIKKKQFPWMLEISKFAPQYALENLETSFKNFFRGLKTGQKIGFPKFKSKHESRQSFRFSFTFNITESTIHIPKIGRVRLKEKGYVPTENVHYNSVTVSKEFGRWFASVQCEVEVPDLKKPETVLGVDLGIKTLLTCSNGQVFENNKYFKKEEKKLAHAQRNLSRKIKGSHNRQKAIKIVQKIHCDITNKRKDQIHKMTSALVKTKPRYFALENLNVQGMMKNHSLARTLSDASFGEIRRQFLYKTLWHGGEVIDVDRFFPSSKKCCMCGHIKNNLTLTDRVYACDKCGHTENRDLNAAKNLEQFGTSTLSSRGIQACGESVRPATNSWSEAVSEKQEENRAVNCS